MTEDNNPLSIKILIWDTGIKINGNLLELTMELTSEPKNSHYY